MREEEVMSDNVGLGGRVPGPTECMEKDGALPGWEQPHIVALNREGVRLIQGDPILHLVSIFLEACFSICSVILSMMPKTKHKKSHFTITSCVHMGKRDVSLITLFEG